MLTREELFKNEKNYEGKMNNHSGIGPTMHHEGSAFSEYAFTDYARWKYAVKNVFSNCTNPKPNPNLHCTPTLLLT